jgi:hypothetical protein
LSQIIRAYPANHRLDKRACLIAALATAIFTSPAASVPTVDIILGSNQSCKSVRNYLATHLKNDRAGVSQARVLTAEKVDTVSMSTPDGDWTADVCVASVRVWSEGNASDDINIVYRVANTDRFMGNMIIATLLEIVFFCQDNNQDSFEENAFKRYCPG